MARILIPRNTVVPIALIRIKMNEIRVYSIALQDSSRRCHVYALRVRPPPSPSSSPPRRNPNHEPRWSTSLAYQLPIWALRFSPDPAAHTGVHGEVFTQMRAPPPNPRSDRRGDGCKSTHGRTSCWCCRSPPPPLPCSLPPYLIWMNINLFG